MGYPTTDVFDIKFIERTRQNLEEFKGTNNFTNLINNLIGLIFIPHEYNNKGLRKSLGFLNKKVSEIKPLTNIFATDNAKVMIDGVVNDLPKFKYRKDGKDLNLNEIEIRDILRLVRNSFAHANLIPFGEGKTWEGVIIKNYQDKKKEKKDKYNFIAVLKRQELEDFAIIISNLYLNEHKT